MLCIVAPVYSIIIYKYIQTKDTDYGYRHAQASTSYHVYRPTTLPQGMTYATTFVTDADFAGTANGTHVVLDAEFNKLAAGENKFTMIQQTGVADDFDLSAFANSGIKGTSPAQAISFEKALENKAYIFSKSSQESTLHYLTYLTPDHVLILFFSPRLLPNELLDIARTLN